MPTLGSLFDGIGGFPLAAVRNGIEPVWASEIEAFPIEVTRKRFPSILHVGDITKLNGAELPPVDIITGGSPCQDLSVAGARAGLAGERLGVRHRIQPVQANLARGRLKQARHQLRGGGLARTVEADDADPRLRQRKRKRLKRLSCAKFHARCIETNVQTIGPLFNRPPL